MPNAGRHNRCQARKDTGAKPGKACNRCQAQENMRSVPSEGKKFNWFQARENTTSVKVGKTYNRTSAKDEKTRETSKKNRQLYFLLSIEDRFQHMPS